MYDEPTVPEIRINELAEFISKLTAINVEVRQSFFRYFNVNKKTFQEIASCKVFNLYVPFERHNPTAEEMSLEEKENINNIVLYDGFELQNVLRDLIPDSELSQDKFHIIFTNRLTCSYDYADYRYHGRAVICSNPSIISTTGIIEAPAKPREYYLQMSKKMSQGLNINVLKRDFQGRFLEYNDPRLALVVRGYALQTMFYYLTGKPFCESKECVLYNAHWQEELLHSQIKIKKLCKQHETLLGSF